MAFEYPKQYRMVYARSLDIADYYRRHYAVTPRTVFVSKTDHLDYDKNWLCTWGDDRMLVPRKRLPWYTRMSSVFADRRRRLPHKDPLSQEYILVEDQQRQLRFERECPHPIWYYDYTVQERGPLGSTISYTETPDVNIVRSRWLRQDGQVSITLAIHTEASFPDYALALWGVPTAYSPDRSRIETNAKDFVLARNTDGEFHLVLFFDLYPNAELPRCAMPAEGGRWYPSFPRSWESRSRAAGVGASRAPSLRRKPQSRAMRSPRWSREKVANLTR